MSLPSTSDSTSPFAPGNLLPVGIVELCLHNDSPSDYASEDGAGWHDLLGKNMIFQHSDHDAIYGDLHFLTAHDFIRATFRVLDVHGSYQECFPKMCIRVYLVPNDLMNVQGRLRVRNRDPIVLGRAQMSLRKIFSMLKHSWDGSEPDASSYFMPPEHDSRTMSEIYSGLASPTLSTRASDNGLISRLLDSNRDLKDLLGLRSTLYQYQQETVSAMLDKEIHHGVDIPDPSYISLRSLDGKTFFLQPSTLEILQESPMVTPARGGVLCEELGTGKTLMVLTLILATLHDISAPEESLLETRHTLTPIALKHFPDHASLSARQRAKRGKRNDPPYSKPRIPSFVELLVHHTRVSSQSLAHLEDYEERLTSTGLLPRLRASFPFYHQYEEKMNTSERAQRHRTEPSPKVMYLTSATLVVVPPNLIAQWEREIHKHSRIAIRVLTFARTKDKLPTARSLANDYDVILTTYTKLSDEYSRRNISKLHSWKKCNCSEFPEFSASRPVRVPKCKCAPGDPSVSPFLQVRWKRIVIDEGHVAAFTSTNFNHFVALLSVERRWIVTGTPTTNLLGLNFGSGTRSDSETDASSSLSSGTLDSATAMTPIEGRSNDSSAPTENAPRIWTKYDREDLRKMTTMIQNFVGFPFPEQAIQQGLLDPAGPRPYSIVVLVQLLQSVMIRHRIEDVEKDVVLPPIEQETVLLDLDEYAVKSYNAFLATLAVNAIDSERKDKDYMFHAANSTSLLRAVTNMSQLMFWSADVGLYNVDEQLKHSEARIKLAKDRNMSMEDQNMLAAAVRHVKTAAGDPVWRAINTNEDVPFRVSEMHSKIFCSWTRTPSNSTPGLDVAEPTMASGVMHVDRILNLRKYVVSRPLAQLPMVVAAGKLQAQDDTEYRIALERAESSRHGKRNSKSSPVKVALEPTKLTEIKKNLHNALAKLESTLEAEDSRRDVDMTANEQVLPQFFANTTAHDTGIHHEYGSILGKSPSGLANVRIGSSCSTKLNYILNEVVQHCSDEKILIFSDSPLTLAHVAQGLDLIKVDCLDYNTDISPHIREQLVLTFETSDKYRVFLMQLKHGARGLNLVSASRVIFCEPVWQADIESQAIKRAHRIGQTKAITVKTLAIRNTAEEAMMKRRAALKLERSGKLPSMTNEVGMRHYIEHPIFIEDPPKLVCPLDIPLLPLPPPPQDEVTPVPIESSSTTAVQILAGDSNVGADSPTRQRAVRESIPSLANHNSRDIRDAPPSPKKRKIRFAD